jgi:hypothetical protein
MADPTGITAYRTGLANPLTPGGSYSYPPNPTTFTTPAADAGSSLDPTGGTASGVYFLEGGEHYDPLRCFYLAQAYSDANSLGLDYSDQIAAAAHRWGEQFAGNYGRATKGWQTHVRGMLLHYRATRKSRAYDLAAAVAGYSPYLTKTGGGMTVAQKDRLEQTNAREMAFALRSMLDAETLGLTRSRTNIDDTALALVDMIGQWIAPWGYRPKTSYVRPFMVAIACHALALYWDRYRTTLPGGSSQAMGQSYAPLASVPGWIKTALDWVWTNGWRADVASPRAGGNYPSTLPAGTLESGFLYTATIEGNTYDTTAGLDSECYTLASVGTVNANVGGDYQTTVVLESGASAVDDVYKHAKTQFVSRSTTLRTGSHFVRRYTGSTRTLVLGGYFNAAPQAGDRIVLTFGATDTAVHQIYSGGVAPAADKVVTTAGRTIVGTTFTPSTTDNWYWYLYGYITVTSAGANQGQTRRITAYDYDAGVGTFTVASAFPEAIGADDELVLTYGDPFNSDDPDENIRILNLMIAPLYAWYYHYTARYLGSADTDYRDQHDLAFNNSGLVRDDTDITPKQWNQNVCYSIDGLRWRSWGESTPASATGLALTAPPSPTCKVNERSDFYEVALSGGVWVDTPVTITPESDLGGQFFPETAILTPEQPWALFRYRPVEEGSHTLSFYNDGDGWVTPTAVFTASGTAPLATGYAITGPATVEPGALASFTLAYTPSGAVPPVALDAMGGVCRVLLSDGDSVRRRFRMPALVGFPEAQAAVPTDVTYPAGYVLAGPSGIAGAAYLAASEASYTITPTNDGGLTNPAAQALEIVTSGTHRRLRVRRHLS